MDSTCYLHSDAPAVGLCAECKKSICSQCIVHSGGSVFCSDACATAMKGTGKELHRSLKKLNRARPVAKLIRTLILGFIVLLILEFFNITDFLGFI